MARKHFHARFQQPRRNQPFCCKEFNRRWRWLARRALKRYQKRHRLTSVDGLQKGRCPAGHPECL